MEITFLTLYLGLAMGSQPVEIATVGAPAAIELRLDGRTLARLEQPPWRTTVDFGATLLPHELEAVALAADGAELARAQQWINLPRPAAEAQILLERDATGRPTAARLSWQSLTGAQPAAIDLTLDGQALALAAGGLAALPPLDFDRPHVLSAELRFADGIAARCDRVLGGRFGDELATELTAVPVVVPRRLRLPPAEELTGWLEIEGRPLRVAAVETGDAQLLLVRDLDIKAALASLGSTGGRVRDGLGRGALTHVDPNYYRFALRLPAGDGMRFLWPTAKAATGSTLPVELFDSSRTFTASDGGLHWLLTTVRHPAEQGAGQRFADAAAVAGLQALSGNRRRAVLVVLADAADQSRLSPAGVRGYLTAARVPLFVWSLRHSGPQVAAWAPAEVVTSPARLNGAFARLAAALAAQRIVWVEGRHPPHRIQLATPARHSGLRLAGEGDTSGAE